MLFLASLTFFILKLTGPLAGWSWWAVATPVLVEVGLTVLTFLFIGIGLGVAFLLGKK